MLGTIRLYKGLGFKQDNTMYFANVQAQNTFFNNPTLNYSDFTDVTYNGSRAFRININFIDFMFLEYDYLRFEFPDNGSTKTIYAFIDNIEYVNDNVCAIQATIDVIQTFMFEIFSGYKSSVINNYTLKQSNFNKYLPYSNKYDVSAYNITKLDNFLNVSAKLKQSFPNRQYGYLVVAIDPKAPLINKTFEITYDNGTVLPYITLLIPFAYENRTVVNPTFYYNGEPLATQQSISYLLGSTENAPYILNISYVTSSFFNETFDIEIDESSNVKFNIVGSGATLSPFTLLPLERKCLILENNATTTKNIALPQIDKGLMRTPYYQLFIGNAYDNVQVNLLDFYNDVELENANTLTIKYLTSRVFPYQVTMQISLNGRDFQQINTPLMFGNSDNVIYSTSEWATYVSQNRQYANSGLKTQQDYEKRVLNKETQGMARESNVNFAANMVSGIGHAMVSLATGSPAGAIAAINNITSAATNTVNTVIGIETKQNVQAVEQQKARAMQSIQFNDLKTSPSTYTNLNSALSQRLFATDYFPGVYLYIARNIEDVKFYHKLYGYSINKQLTGFNFYTLRQHQNYDYISFVNLFIKGNIPMRLQETAEDILTTGIRFWFNYDNFLDYSVENGEYNG